MELMWECMFKRVHIYVNSLILCVCVCVFGFYHLSVLCKARALVFLFVVEVLLEQGTNDITVMGLITSQHLH